ncbi:hypothetical protein [Methanosarcina sp. KYL-1]|uniref:hypothetical protein n=1 Tax=Methanosarcina sp. KYL-1 TaxID=2602068 RepID=UPI002101B07A|nr:hypothetical protein [Methanosarcina sp. KYL-1]
MRRSIQAPSHQYFGSKKPHKSENAFKLITPKKFEDFEAVFEVSKSKLSNALSKSAFSATAPLFL